MARRANGLGVALGVLGCGMLGSLAAGLHGCSGSPAKPDPTKLSEEQTLVDPPRRPDKTGRFINPNEDPPPARQPQLAAEAVEEALAEAKALVAAGTPARAVAPLRRCANRTPASARCDGELGVLLAELGTQKAHMQFFLAEAAKTDDPLADADLYRRIAAAARRRGQGPARADAMATLVARGEATARDRHEYAQALSADATRIDDAVAELQAAYAADPTQHAWLLERGVLAAQTGDWPTAERALQSYLDQAPPEAPDRAAATQRLATVRAELAAAATKPAPDATAPDPKAPDPKAPDPKTEASAGGAVEPAPKPAAP